MIVDVIAALIVSYALSFGLVYGFHFLALNVCSQLAEQLIPASFSPDTRFFLSYTLSILLIGIMVLNVFNIPDFLDDHVLRLRFMNLVGPVEITFASLAFWDFGKERFMHKNKQEILRFLLIYCAGLLIVTFLHQSNQFMIVEFVFSLLYYVYIIGFPLYFVKMNLEKHYGPFGNRLPRF